MTAAPIPVTLLTGFLGSGKTTLLNHLLRDPRMARTAVIVNEFGAVGLDHDLIETARESTVLLTSGCLCCSLRDDLARTLTDLRDRRAAGEAVFDRVVIETSGIADPGPVLQTLVLEPDLAEDFALDAVLTTADAVAGPATLDARFEAVQQVAMADRLILTKTDLVPPVARAAFETRLAAINPGAARLVADNGRLDPGLLFGLAPRRTSTRAQALDWLAEGRAPGRVPNGLPPLSGLAAPGLFDRPPPLAAAPHDARVSAQSARIEGPIPAIAFNLWLESLMGGAAADILRLKAVIHVEGMDHPLALHAVQHVVHPPVPLPHWPRGDAVSRIVVIGRDLPAGFLDASLRLLAVRADRIHRL